jgi:hypothetical protein
MSNTRNAAVRFDSRGARSQVLWRVTQAEREVRCEVRPALSGAAAGCYLLLFIDGQLANCGFHSTPASLIDCASDLHSALRNIVWDDSDGPDPGVSRVAH